MGARIGSPSSTAHPHPKVAPVTTCVARDAPSSVPRSPRAAVGSAACGPSANGEEVTSLAPPPPAAGHPPGTITFPMGNDMAAAVKKVQDAITANGGTVLATVDNAADASAVGVTIPANTVVIGGAPATGLPMLRTNQQAAAALPERYLLRQDRHGAVQLVYNGPDYVAAVSGVTDLAASNPFAQATLVADQASGTPGDPSPPR